MENIEGKKGKTSAYIVELIIFICLLSFFFLLDYAGIILEGYAFFTTIKAFIIIFSSLFLEALPFLLIGCIISSIIEVFVTEKTILRFIPKNRIAGIVVASLLGLIFPVCECATVPIIRRLIRKGVPLHIGITFMLSVPIVNPFVLLSTYFAFWDRPFMVLLRPILGMAGAVTIGFIISLIMDHRLIEKPMRSMPGHESDRCYHNHDEQKKIKGIKDTVLAILRHTGTEFYEIGRFFILGAFLASAIQVMVPHAILSLVGTHPFLSLLIMGGLAYGLSICSEADAFVVRRFLGIFTPGSLVVFLILGPMIDIKNTLMLASTFRPRFIIILTVLIFVICTLLGFLVNSTPVGGSIS
jgi:uncharacterized membrane protein YraQ (UPF0718 family)